MIYELIATAIFIAIVTTWVLLSRLFRRPASTRLDPDEYLECMYLDIERAREYRDISNIRLELKFFRQRWPRHSYQAELVEDAITDRNAALAGEKAKKQAI